MTAPIPLVRYVIMTAYPRLFGASDNTLYSPPLLGLSAVLEHFLCTDATCIYAGIKAGRW
jgi:hypothetical protein